MPFQSNSRFVVVNLLKLCFSEVSEISRKWVIKCPKIERPKLFASKVVFQKTFLIHNVIIGLHKEFSTGWDSRGVWIGSIKDVTIWRVPRMVATHPRNILLESLVEVEQRPRHDNIVIHWHQEWNSNAGKPDT